MAEAELLYQVLYPAARGDVTHLITYYNGFEKEMLSEWVQEGDDLEAKRMRLTGPAHSSNRINQVFDYRKSLAEQLFNRNRFLSMEDGADDFDYREANKWSYIFNNEIGLKTKKRKGHIITWKAIDYTLMKANEIAQKKHYGERRKNGDPYIEHPRRVAFLVSQYSNSSDFRELMAAALLHDVLENTETTSEEIEKIFGSVISKWVLELTTNKEDKKRDGKQNVLQTKMCGMSDQALTIKLCDRLDNVNDAVNAKEEFRIHYIDETMGILDYLLKNRKSFTDVHLVIIEQIIGALAKQCFEDGERIRKVQQLGVQVLALIYKKPPLASVYLPGTSEDGDSPRKLGGEPATPEAILRLVMRPDPNAKAAYEIWKEITGRK